MQDTNSPEIRWIKRKNERNTFYEEEKEQFHHSPQTKNSRSGPRILSLDEIFEGKLKKKEEILQPQEEEYEMSHEEENHLSRRVIPMNEIKKRFFTIKRDSFDDTETIKRMQNSRKRKIHRRSQTGGSSRLLTVGTLFGEEPEEPKKSSRHIPRSKIIKKPKKRKEYKLQKKRVIQKKEIKKEFVLPKKEKKEKKEKNKDIEENPIIFKKPKVKKFKRTIKKSSVRKTTRILSARTKKTKFEKRPTSTKPKTAVNMSIKDENDEKKEPSIIDAKPWRKNSRRISKFKKREMEAEELQMIDLHRKNEEEKIIQQLKNKKLSIAKQYSLKKKLAMIKSERIRQKRKRGYI